MSSTPATVATVLLIGACAILPVTGTIRRVCDERDTCGRQFLKNKFSIRKVGTDATNETQTCVDQCVFFPLLSIRAGYECGECTTSTIVNDFSSELIVSSCNESSINVQGTSVGSLQVGENFIYVGTSGDICINCSSLFRKIISISDGPTDDSRILTTSFATFIDIFDDDVVDMSIAADIEVEPVFNCTYGSDADRLLHSLRDTNRKLQSFPFQCPDWRSVNSDGRCSYTDCFVGTDGDPNDCFVCKDTCDNTCGSEGGIKVSGNFILYDFGEACCIHDHCYNSVFDQDTCDQEFLVDMLSTCPFLPTPLIRVLGPIGFIGLQGACPLTALLFYSLVSNFGADPYAAAQAMQREYEETPVCVARCPTTQTSGGQGGTRLVIDLLETSGTFPVSYEMYGIPDELSIDYEGTIIYSTGGLVSGGSSVDVSYAGSSTLIEVTVNAPLDGTRYCMGYLCWMPPGTLKK